MDAKEYLEQYQTYKKRIERLTWTIKELESLAESTTKKLDGMPHGSGMKSPMEYFITKKIDKETELQNQIESTQQLLMEIEKTITEIDDYELEMLLHYRYVEGLQWSGAQYYFNKAKSPYIVDKMGYSRSWIDEMHKRALDKVQTILDKKDTTGHNWTLN